MERKPENTFDLQIAYLERRKSRKIDFAQNLSKRGWIESFVKDHSLRGWERLSLTCLSDEEYFERLRETIIPLQITLVGRSLPDIEQRLQRLTKAKQAAEVRRIQEIRDNFTLNPLHPPLRNYSDILRYPNVRNFLRNANRESASLLENFLQSPGARRVLNAIARFFDTQTFKEPAFDQYLASAAHEEMGYLYAASQSRRGNITILNPEETSILFRNIHRQKDFDPGKSYGLNFNVQGLSLPDGLVISNTGSYLDIVLAAEYKIIGKNNYDISHIRAQAEYFSPEQLESDLRLKNHQPLEPDYVGRLLHAIHRSLPALPVRVSPQLKTLYVIPRGADIKLGGILIEETSVTAAAISAFVRMLKGVKFPQRRA